MWWVERDLSTVQYSTAVERFFDLEVNEEADSLPHSGEVLQCNQGSGS